MTFRQLRLGAIPVVIFTLAASCRSTRARTRKRPRPSISRDDCACTARPARARSKTNPNLASEESEEDEESVSEEDRDFDGLELLRAGRLAETVVAYERSTSRENAATSRQEAREMLEDLEAAKPQSDHGGVSPHG